MRALLFTVLLALCGFAIGAETPPAPPPPSASAGETTPPRLSFIDGKASFWRVGADDWAPARINTPLAPGDVLYTGAGANLEIQVGPRAFIRAAERTQIGIVGIEPDFLQIKVTGGRVSLDLRSIAAGHTVELDTPNAVFTIEHAGYYNAIVGADLTRFVTRRGGRATITPAEGPPQAIAPSEEVIVRGADGRVATYAAPELDAWDRWNYARTDHEIEALSARYVGPGVYGVGVLDQWGTWRVVPTYGPIWIPDRVAPGWAPYSTGVWIWDPYFAWTWVDDAPWGWAPFHYGRWVYIGGLWAWAPGPVIVRPIYAPALVAFFDIGSSVSVRIGIGGPGVGWVALGWGEPLRPWWGPPGFVGRPWWGGWAGPRVVNNVVIERTTIVNINTIVYQHTPRAVFAVEEKQFGGGPVRVKRIAAPDPQALRHIDDAHPVRPRPPSFMPARGETIEPPAALISRSVLTTRAPHEAPPPVPHAPAKAPIAVPAPRVVERPKQPDAGAALPRPSFGEKGAERPRPPQPPRLEDVRRAPAVPKLPERGAAPRPRRESKETRSLPGKPAGGLYSRQSESKAARAEDGKDKAARGAAKGK
jgi:hypothetical protein